VEAGDVLKVERSIEVDRADRSQSLREIGRAAKGSELSAAK